MEGCCKIKPPEDRWYHGAMTDQSDKTPKVVNGAGWMNRCKLNPLARLNRGCSVVEFDEARGQLERRSGCAVRNLK